MFEHLEDLSDRSSTSVQTGFKRSQTATSLQKRQLIRSQIEQQYSVECPVYLVQLQPTGTKPICLFFVYRTRLSIGPGITDFTISTARRTRTPITQREDSSSRTWAGCSAGNTRTSRRKGKESISVTWRTILYWRSRKSEHPSSMPFLHPVERKISSSSTVERSRDKIPLRIDSKKIDSERNWSYRAKVYTIRSFGNFFLAEKLFFHQPHAAAA